MEESKLRIRLMFKNGVLRKSQNKNGLKKSWLLLKPHHETISDVISYILHSFHLLHSCPHGIILSMEGYVLPEFESTSILKDRDLICVKRKGTRLVDASKSVGEANTYIENQIVEKQPIRSCVRFLTNEEFHNDIDEDIVEDLAEKSTSPVQNSCDGHLVSKKRKSSSTSENSRKKRKRESIVNTSQKNHLLNYEHKTKPQKKRKYENKSNQNALSCPGITENSGKDLEPGSNTESEHDKNKEDTIMQAPSTSDRAKKVSRNTKRKRAQNALKRLQREKAKMDEQCDKQQPVKDMGKDTGSKKDAVANIIQTSYEDSDAEDDDLVPVEIRPGLIRFTPLGKVKEVQEANSLDGPSTQNGTREEHSTKHNKVAKEAYCWNGITNKRKGQKWGQKQQSNSTWDDRKKSTSSWKDCRDVSGHSSRAWDAKNQSSSSWQDSKDINGQSCSTWADWKQPLKKSINFDKLIPLIDPPKAGDIIAYRLLELSSSLCPELSSFRVGKITSFEAESEKIMLVPVPDYPLNLNKKVFADADEQSLGSSTYNEDGSLETDFLSLNDVRIVKLGELIPLQGTKMPTANGNSTPQTSKWDNGAQDASKKGASETSNQELHTPGPANGKKDVWEEICEAASAKKAQLLQEDNWNKKPAKRSWSYRSQRSNAMGHTMARLRGQNGA